MGCMSTQKDLLFELVKTDFRLRYQGSVLGFVWAFLKPLLLFIILYIVFSTLGRGDTSHFPIYLLIGLVIYTLFAEGTTAGMQSPITRASVLKGIKFPREIVVIAAALNAAISFLFNVGVLFILMFFLGFSPTASGLLQVVGLLLLLFLLLLGSAFLLAILYVHFRDIHFAWELFLQVLFFATPIFYPVSLIDERIRPYYLLNPLTMIIQDVRGLLLEGVRVPMNHWIILVMLAFGIFVVGRWVFLHQARKFVEAL
jgi:ABC-2 type transport system permease protein